MEETPEAKQKPGWLHEPGNTPDSRILHSANILEETASAASEMKRRQRADLNSYTLPSPSGYAT
jgi:hypothetical protein